MDLGKPWTGPLNPTPAKILRCIKKVGHESKKSAEESIRYIFSKVPSRKLRAYRCPECGKWHLAKKK